MRKKDAEAVAVGRGGQTEVRMESDHRNDTHTKAGARTGTSTGPDTPSGPGPKISVVSASAGSSKTYRLSGLLLDEIKSGRARPDAVLCTTFTNKAAAELQSRVRGRLLEDGLTREADALSSARIGTVNAVCGQLAAQFAFELGLSPELRVLDETTAAQLLAQSISTVVTPEELERLGGLRQRMVEFDWSDAVRRMVDLARTNLLEADALRDSAGPVADRLLRQFGPVGNAETEEHFDAALKAALEAFTGGVDQKADATQKTADALSKCRLAAAQLRRGASPDWAAWVNLANLDAGKKSAALAEAVRFAAAEHDCHPRLHRDVREATVLVYELAARTLEAYAHAKRERGVLDFVDQEVHAHALLDRPDVQERLGGELDLVLVDEFQDTSPLQLSLFLKLARLTKRSVWVGDQKQSIYGFRGADPALMDAAIEALCGARGPETLDKSFRSRPPLVEATSEAFARAFAAHGMPETRVRLTPHKPDDAAELGPWLESWTLKAKRIADELQALATGVRTLLRDPTLRVRDRVTGGPRTVRPSDIAALCFSNAQCHVVADALEGLGIRAVVPRSGLFSTPEGVAALAGLRLFVDGRDALAAAEVARVLSYADDPDAFLAKALLQPEAESFKALEACQRLRAAAEARRSAGAIGALDAVLEALELREHCLSWGRAPQRLANLEALRAHAVGFAAVSGGDGAAASAAGLVAYFEALEKDALDAQATAAGDDAVVVSTWHAAKGLEWPVTILYGGPPETGALGICVEESVLEAQAQADADSRPGSGAEFRGSRRFSLENPLAGRSIRYWPTPYRLAHKKTLFFGRLQESREHAEAVAAAERQNLRVLYVGWTRARDRLVLAARPGGHEGPLVKALRTGASIGIGTLTGSGTAAVTGTGTGASLVVPSEGDLLVAGRPAGAVLRTLEVAAPEAAPIVPGAAPVARGPRAYPAAFVTPSSAEGQGVLLSVTSIGDRVPLSGDPDMNALGEAVHGFLASDVPGRDPAARLALADALLQRWMVRSALRPSDLVTLSDRLRAHIDVTWPGAVWHREWPIQQQLENGSVSRGSVDLVLELPDSAGFVVIDHKTFPGTRAQAEARVVEYGGQLGAYAAAIAAATGARVLGTFIHLPVSGLIASVGSAETSRSVTG